MARMALTPRAPPEWRRAAKSIVQRARLLWQQQYCYSSQAQRSGKRSCHFHGILSSFSGSLAYPASEVGAVKSEASVSSLKLELEPVRKDPAVNIRLVGTT